MSDDTVKKTGRGFLVITAAKVWFLITGAAVQLGLPIIFGSAEMFGVFKIVTEAISLINMVMITGTLQAVSKLVSEEPDKANGVVNLAIKLQLCLGVPLAGAYALGAPWIAESFNDPALTGLIRLSSLIVLFYAFYAIFVGYLNGLKEYVRQASLDITFATLKTAGILGLVALGFGVIGAVAGFVVAAGIICVISGVWTFIIMRRKAKDSGGKPAPATLKRLLGFLVLIMLYTFALNGVMRADLFVLKSVAADVPAHLVGADAIFKIISDKFSGFYGAVLNVARIPYQGVIAVTFVIFPLISESTFREDHDTTRAYIRTTFRYCMILIASVAVLLALNSDSIIAGLYSTDYQAASTALAYLSVSIIFFALLYVAATIIIGAGDPLAAVVIMGVGLAVSAVLNYLFVSGIHAEVMAGLQWTSLGTVPSGDAASRVQNAVLVAQNDVALAGPYLLEGPRYMASAAIATTVAMVSACVLSILWIGVRYKAWLPVPTLIRILIATAVLYGFDLVVPTPVEWVAEYGKLVFLAIVAAKMAVMGILLLVVLAITREFGAEDVERLRKVIGRKAGKLKS
jgi:O-antigen/teichoic acid export membrane protein